MLSRSFVEHHCLFLSCLAAPLMVDSLKGGRQGFAGVVNLVVDSCLALRNMNVVHESSLKSNAGATSHLDSDSRVEV